MLRWKEKEDLDQRTTQVDGIVGTWRVRDAAVSDKLRDEFQRKLQVSWIFHDAALEGDVLTYSEIKAATDRNIVSDVSLIPSYEDIKCFDAACTFAIDYAQQKKKPINVDLVRKLYGMLAPEEVAKGCPYRKENPLHRLYYHEIAPPEKISYRMRKFSDWLDGPEAAEMHPIRRAAHAHWMLMAIYPWAKHAGRTARILTNMMLIRAEYPIAVIHQIDRQRYYEGLRADDSSLFSLYLESVETTASSAIRVYHEAVTRNSRRRRAS